jgi:DNA-binding GntR family transcriptional regulator
VREVNRTDLEEIRIIRHRLDPLALHLAVGHATEHDLHTAERLRARMSVEPEMANWLELHSAYHAVFYDATQNGHLAGILCRLEESSTLFVAQAQVWQPQIQLRDDVGHRLLLEAVRDRDATRASKLMAEHTAIVMQLTSPVGVKAAVD